MLERGPNAVICRVYVEEYAGAGGTGGDGKLYEEH